MREQIGRCGLRIGNQVDRGRTHLVGIVRRDARGHTDRDTRRTIGQQIRERGRQHHRLLILIVIRGAEIHGIFGNAGQETGGDRRHPCFGVAHGGRVIAIDIAEITLAFHQRVTHGEILRQAHQRIVDTGVTMRMELAHHVAHHTRALLEAAGRIEL